MGSEPSLDRFQLRRRLDAARFRKSVADIISQKDPVSGRSAKGFNDTTDLRDGFGRGTQERKEAFPRILLDEPQASIFLNGSMNERIPINLLQDKIQIFIQSEKMGQEGLIHSFKEKGISFLPEREGSIRGLDDIGLYDLGISEELSAFQSLFERKRLDVQPMGHFFSSSGGRITARV
jgi:hypothetical protein